jgi:hypothetical protein
MEVKKMTELGKYIAEKVSPLEEGKYTGRITDIARDTENYDYTRYQVTLDSENSPVLTVSYPSRITVLPNGQGSTQHAKFLLRMGVNIKESVDMAKEIVKLMGKQITFLVENRETEQGTFSEIVKSSVKLLDK